MKKDTAVANPTAQLKRSLSVVAVTFYGVGAILGAGIYVLIGEVAGLAGYRAPLAFLLAAIIAAFSACSYAELSAQFPRSAGEAVYVDKAFNSRGLTMLVGWLVVFTGVVSAATMATGVVGYAQSFVPWSAAVLVIIFVVFVGVIALWGINQSSFVVALITLLEAGGLVYVIILAGDELQNFPFHQWLIDSGPDIYPLSGLLLAGFMALYAFIGFEDMVNIAEEVKRPAVTLPRAIWAALIIATVLYMAVAIAALSVVPPETLAQSSAPLALVVSEQGHATAWISLISLLAVVNGAIVQLIMASRVMYGMAQAGLLPAVLATIHSYTHTPIVATLLSIAVTLLLALLFPLSGLAQATSFIILMVFALVNGALFWLKRVEQPELVVSYPRFVPLLGLLLCLAALLVKVWDVVG